MDMRLKQEFVKLWRRYFDGADLPITLYYTPKEGVGTLVSPPSDHLCVVPVLSKVRRGESLCFQADSIGCAGGKRYLGFTREIMPDFEYFLSCGIPGRLEGERYKKSPELVREIYEGIPVFEAPSRFIVFKRWDSLEEGDEPDVVIFLALPDVLAGLFTLANFDEVEPDAVFAPFGAGCATIVQYPYLERGAARPRAVLGMFDVSARPFVPNHVLTFSVPIRKFVRMVENMEESFLITGSWEKVLKRIRLRK